MNPVEITDESSGGTSSSSGSGSSSSSSSSGSRGGDNGGGDTQPRSAEDPLFTLDLPEFYLSQAIDMFGCKGSLALLGHGYKPGIEPWRLFELLPIYAVCIRSVREHLGGQKDLTWATALPELLAECSIAKSTQFSLSPGFRVEYSTDKLPGAIEDNPQQFFNSATIPQDMSSSADLFFVQHAKWGFTVIEWQLKLRGEGDGLQFHEVATEISKSNTTFPTIFILCCTWFGTQLASLIESGVLVLSSWDGKSTAAYGIAGKSPGTLLWRSESNTSWFEYPNKSRVSKKRPSTDTTLLVRPKLELVIPSPVVIDKFFGERVMASIGSLKSDATHFQTFFVGLNDLIEENL